MYRKALTSRHSKWERDVSSVLLLANGGCIYGAAQNATTSAVAIRRQTSTPLRIFAKLATSS
jgi:hypothetical protein